VPPGKHSAIADDPLVAEPVVRRLARRRANAIVGDVRGFRTQSGTMIGGADARRVRKHGAQPHPAESRSDARLTLKGASSACS
jgi:hypothetical protein